MALRPGQATTDGAKRSFAETRDDTQMSLTLRYSNQKAVSCSESRERVARRRFSCRPDKQWVSGSATLKFIPLPDSRRRVFGPDRREPFTVHLDHTSQPLEMQIAIAKGPWRIAWKEASKSVRADVERSGSSAVLTTKLGGCRVGTWRCRLDPTSKENKLEFRPFGRK